MRNPEDFGLETIGTIDLSEGSYDFHVVAVFKESRGRYWIGRDSGCSCSYPFEFVEEINQLDGPHNKDNLRKRLDYIGRELRGRYVSLAEYRREAISILSRLT